MSCGDDMGSRFGLGGSMTSFGSVEGLGAGGRECGRGVSLGSGSGSCGGSDVVSGLAAAAPSWSGLGDMTLLLWHGSHALGSLGG